jgi:hypothetical protein
MFQSVDLLTKRWLACCFALMFTTVDGSIQTRKHQREDWEGTWAERHEEAGMTWSTEPTPG